jgi:hypothetical protein
MEKHTGSSVNGWALQYSTAPASDFDSSIISFLACSSGRSDGVSNGAVGGSRRHPVQPWRAVNVRVSGKQAVHSISLLDYLRHSV